LFSILNFWSASAATTKWGKDPAQMVIDEWAGFGLALSAMFEWFPIKIESFDWSDAISPELTVFICAFALFRLFDIIKPLGIARLQQFNGALGILIDDLAAGGLTAITLNVLSRLI
jgi:phosphatidylglycerophosphatase A